MYLSFKTQWLLQTDLTALGPLKAVGLFIITQVIAPVYLSNNIPISAEES